MCVLLAVRLNNIRLKISYFLELDFVVYTLYRPEFINQLKYIFLKKDCVHVFPRELYDFNGIISGLIVISSNIV